MSTSSLAPGSATREVRAPDATLLMLMPAQTMCLASNGPLEDNLPDHSPFRSLAKNLASYNATVLPRDWLLFNVLRGAAENVHDLTYRNANFKLTTEIAHKLAEYLSAHLLFDRIVKLQGCGMLKVAMVRQPKQSSFIGKQVLLEPLQDINQILLGMQTANSRNEEGSSTSHSILLRKGLAGIAIGMELEWSTKAASRIVRNIGAVAFYIRWLMVGRDIRLPDTMEALLRPLGGDERCAAEGSDEIRKAVNRRQFIRRAFYIATLVSPLTLLSGTRDIASGRSCPEELIVSCRCLGNCLPGPVDELHKDFWAEVLPVAEMRQTAFNAFSNLTKRWRGKLLAVGDNKFFARGKPTSHTNEHLTQPVLRVASTIVYTPQTMSMFKTAILHPLPESWPLDSVKKYVFIPDIPETSLNDEEMQDQTVLESLEYTQPEKSSQFAVMPNTESPSESETLFSYETCKAVGVAHLVRDGEDVAMIDGTARHETPDSTKLSGPGKIYLDSGEMGVGNSFSKAGGQSTEAVENNLKVQLSGLEEALSKLEDFEPHAVPDIPHTLSPLQTRFSDYRFSDFVGYSFSAWDSEGNCKRMWLIAHHKPEYEGLHRLLTVMQDQYCEKWAAKTDKELQTIFSDQNMLVPGYAFSPYNRLMPHLRDLFAAKFDIATVGKVFGELDRSIAIQDLSIPVEDGPGDDVRLRRCTPRDLCVVADKPGDQRKALNALRCSLENVRVSSEGTFDYRLASDLHALQNTAGLRSCDQHISTTTMRWADAGTTGGTQLLCIDNQGDCTFTVIVAGIKLLIVAEPRSARAISSIRTFSEVDASSISSDEWRVEGVILNAGDLWHVAHPVPWS
ncbi:hypothetical protein NMY22_g7759 [Coprinellus aureogranulatus]|nr:hypothetical protein NMY22_g7759 [Coprinellus aureogranulatus]